MGVGAGLYMYDVVVKSSRSLFHLLMSSYCTSHSRVDRPTDRPTDRAVTIGRIYICSTATRPNNSKYKIIHKVI